MDTTTTTTASPARDSLGVPILEGDRVTITAWGRPTRLADVGRPAVVARITPAGRIALAPTDLDGPIARGRAVDPKHLTVRDRTGGDGHEANRLARALEDHTKWLDTHCYSCGGELERPISSLTEAELNDINGPNSDHRRCFEE